MTTLSITSTPKKFYTTAFFATHPELAAVSVPLPQSNKDESPMLPLIDGAADPTLKADEAPEHAVEEGKELERMTRYPIVRPLPENTNIHGIVINWADDPWDVLEFLDYFHYVSFPHIPPGNYHTKAEHDERMEAERAIISKNKAQVQEELIIKRAVTKKEQATPNSVNEMMLESEKPDQVANANSKQTTTIAIMKSEEVVAALDLIDSAIPKFFDSRIDEGKSSEEVDEELGKEDKEDDYFYVSPLLIETHKQIAKEFLQAVDEREQAKMIREEWTRALHEQEARFGKVKSQEALASMLKKKAKQSAEGCERTLLREERQQITHNEANLPDVAPQPLNEVTTEVVAPKNTDDPSKMQLKNVLITLQDTTERRDSMIPRYVRRVECSSLPRFMRTTVTSRYKVSET